MKVEKLKELGLISNCLSIPPMAQSIRDGRITGTVGYLKERKRFVFLRAKLNGSMCDRGWSLSCA